MKPQDVRRALSIADKHGFALADLNTNSAMLGAYAELFERENKNSASKTVRPSRMAVHSYPACGPQQRKVRLSLRE